MPGRNRVVGKGGSRRRVVGEGDRLLFRADDRGLQFRLLKFASSQEGPHRFYAAGTDSVKDIMEEYC